MEHKNLFDRVLFDEGDVVIRKYKDGGEIPETVTKSIVVENLDGFSYSVLYFESNPKEFHVAFEYEPQDEDLCNEYYEAWSNVKKVVKEKKSVSKVMKLK